MIDSLIVPLSRPFRCATCLILALSLSSFHAAVGNEAQSRSTAIVKGLQFVGETGTQWIEERECVSCHQVPSMIWSFEAAKSYGANVDDDQLTEWKTWSTSVVSFVKPEKKEDLDVESAMEANIDTMVHLLLAIPATDEESPWRKQFAESLVEHQQPNGSWKACGQLPAQRRPESETMATTTLWTMLALTRESMSFDGAANAFVEKIETPVSTEFVAARLLLASEQGDQASKVNQLRQQLLDQQNEDGGWGWRFGDQSDALGTGYALYALASTGTENVALQQAAEFLVQSQKDDGSWAVPGTKKSAKGKATDTASDWGSAWAVVALSALTE